MNLESTVQSLLLQARAALTESESAALDGELLLAHLLGKSRTWLHTWPEKPVSNEITTAFATLIERRKAGEPVAYLTGTQSFWSLELQVTADTLIPRPETELLVETALASIPTDQPWQIADLGTGSGAIALAIASERPETTLIATDRSEAALEMARANRDRLQLDNVTFHHGSWFEPLGEARFELILSNPPYIAEADPHLDRGDVRFEPDSALTAGEQGLNDLRAIITDAPTHLKPGGQLMVEHGYDQGNAVRSLFQQQGYDEVTTLRDLGGQERITYGTYHGA